jgi:hypothetical protein
MSEQRGRESGFIDAFGAKTAAYPTRLVMLFLALITISWLASVRMMSVQSIPADPFHVARVLPFTYWIGIAALAALFVFMVLRPRRHGHVLVDLTFITVLCLYLHGTYCVAYPLPVPHDAYLFSKVSAWIVNTGHISGNPDYYLSTYPVATILYAQASQLLGISTLTLSRAYPLVSSWLIGFLVYALAHRLTPRYALVAPVAFVSMNWVSQWHMCPQNFGLLVTIAFLWTVVAAFGTGESGNWSHRVVILGMSVAILLAHPTTPLLNLVALTAVVSCFRLVRWIQPMSLVRRDEPVLFRSGPVVSVGVFLFVTYFAYAAFKAGYVTARFVSWGQMMVDNLLYGDVLVITDRAVTAPMDIYVLASNLRLGLTLTVIMAGAIVALYLILTRRSTPPLLWVVSLSAGYLAFSVVLVVAGFNVYGFDRGYVLGLIPLSVLFAYYLGDTRGQRKKASTCASMGAALVVGLVVFSIIMSPVTKNATDPYSFFAESDHAAEVFRASRSRTADAVAFHTREYNWAALKQKGGRDYVARFNSSEVDLVYDAKQSQLMVPKLDNS